MLRSERQTHPAQWVGLKALIRELGVGSWELGVGSWELGEVKA